MNCRCLSGCHPVISKQFSPSPTATTHSPCGRFSHFSLIWHWIWFWICTSINSASPTGSYWGKRSCIWTLACTTQARWFLQRKKSSLANVSLPGNSFWLQRPPPLILQVPGRAKMSGESPAWEVPPRFELIFLRWPAWMESTSWIEPEPHWRDLTLDFPHRYVQCNMKASRFFLTQK